MPKNIMPRSEFIQTLIDRASEWLPPIWRNANVFPKQSKSAQKTGSHILVVRDRSLWDDLQIEINSFYSLYEQGISLENIITYLSVQSFPWRLKNLSWRQIQDFEIARHYIIPILLPTGTNGIAPNTQHYVSKPFVCGDMRVCLNVIKRNKNGMVVRIPVTQELVKSWNQNPDVIFQTAFDNSPSLQPPFLMPYTSWIHTTTGCIPHKTIITEQAWVVTNTDEYYGAICFSYPGFVWKIYKALQTMNIYAIPLNVNLSLVLPKTDGVTALDLLHIVKAMQLTDTTGNLYLTSDVLEEDENGHWKSAIYQN